MISVLAHNVCSKRVAGLIVMHETFRVRIPILSKWEKLDEVFDFEDSDLYHDYIFPIAKDTNTFLYPEYKNLAVISARSFRTTRQNYEWNIAICFYSL